MNESIEEVQATKMFLRWVALLRIKRVKGEPVVLLLFLVCIWYTVLFSYTLCTFHIPYQNKQLQNLWGIELFVDSVSKWNKGFC